ncbi:MAG: hypothetical protein KC964_11730, partial [Candidatus Omnitrophica bacterium]|nr:hypothetical protein [Candidatus Omnitrophota bacterium]
MSKKMRWIVGSGLALVFILVSITYSLGSETTSANPEIISTSTVENLDGVLVHDVPPGGITAISLPDLTETIVRKPSREDGATVHTLSNPDLKGRIAYVQNHMIQKKHSLKVAYLDGSDHHEVFTHPGDALWDHSIGESLALSATGGLIATVGQTNGVQMHDPMALLMEGKIEIWKIEDKSQ